MEPTHFASAERTPIKKIQEVNAVINSIPFVSDVLDATPLSVGIVNCNRQFIFVNKALANFVGSTDAATALGLRPGEAIHCVNETDFPGGCGTSESCRGCGVVLAVLECFHSKKECTRECRMSAKGELTIKALEFKVTVTPFVFSGTEYAILTLQDLSDQKRRQLLERIFYHDLINIAGSLKGLLEYDLHNPEKMSHEEISLLTQISQDLLEEILSQRQLTEAENGELQLNINICSVPTLLSEVEQRVLTFSEKLRNKLIIIPEVGIATIQTDPIVLKRVLVNLVKNALESSPINGTVSIGWKSTDKTLLFWVNNATYIDPDIQIQLFQRSFSTKGPGRGIGTYSVKILTERYLKGTVSFVSNQEFGTTFQIEIPVQHTV